MGRLFDTLKNRVVPSSVILGSFRVSQCCIQVIEEPLDTAPEKVNAADVIFLPGSHTRIRIYLLKENDI